MIYYNFVKHIRLMPCSSANTIFSRRTEVYNFGGKGYAQSLGSFTTFIDDHNLPHTTKPMNYNGIRYRTIWPDPQNKQQICIIDQRKLPHNFIVEKIGTAEQMIIAIRDMHVRGAGLIGASAGFGMYLAALQAPDAAFDSFMADAARRFDASRPTARNLMWAVERILQMIAQSPTPDEKRALAFAVACTIADEDARFCQRIGEHGLKIIEEISHKKKRCTGQHPHPLQRRLAGFRRPWQRHCTDLRGT